MNRYEKRLAEIEDFLRERGRSGKFNFDNVTSVQVIHQYEGSVMFWESAFGIKEKCTWYIFTEHNGSHWFSDDEVLVRFFKRVDDENGLGPLKDLPR